MRVSVCPVAPLVRVPLGTFDACSCPAPLTIHAHEHAIKCSSSTVVNMNLIIVSWAKLSPMKFCQRLMIRDARLRCMGSREEGARRGVMMVMRMWEREAEAQSV